jgi:hypothetical protein
MAEPTSLVPLGREGTGAATVLQSAPFLQERAKMQMLERQNIAKQEAAMAEAIAKKQKDEQDAADVAMKAIKFAEGGDSGLFQEKYNSILKNKNDLYFNVIKQNKDNQKAMGEIGLDMQKYASDAKSTAMYLSNQDKALKAQMTQMIANDYITDEKDVVRLTNEMSKDANDFSSMAKNYVEEYAKVVDQDPEKYNYGVRGAKLYDKMVGKTGIDNIDAEGKASGVLKDNVFSKGKDGKYEVKTTDLEGIIRTDPLADRKYQQLVTAYKKSGNDEQTSRSAAVSRFFGQLPSITIKNDLETRESKSGKEKPLIKDVNSYVVSKKYVTPEGGVVNYDIDLGGAEILTDNKYGFKIPFGTKIYPLQNIDNYKTNKNFSLDRDFGVLRASKNLYTNSAVYIKSQMPVANERIVVDGIVYKKGQPMVTVATKKDVLRSIDPKKYHLEPVAMINPDVMQDKVVRDPAYGDQQFDIKPLTESGLSNGFIMINEVASLNEVFGKKRERRVKGL